MRRILTIFSVILLIKLNAQRYMDYDTIHRNEFSLSFQPVISLFMGPAENSQLSNFQLGYRHYFKNKLVLRAAIVIFPEPNSSNTYYNLNSYDRTINGLNIFRTTYYDNRVKTQLNIGLEKIFKVNRLMHGFGADIFFNRQVIAYNEIYTSYPVGQQVTSYTPMYPQSASPSNMVDSLGSSYNGTKTGLGFQIFYSLRYKISTHWYVSATVGPSINLSVLNSTLYDRRTRKSTSDNSNNMDFPDMPLISDVSICYRF